MRGKHKYPPWMLVLCMGISLAYHLSTVDRLTQGFSLSYADISPQLGQAVMASALSLGLGCLVVAWSNITRTWLLAGLVAVLGIFAGFFNPAFLILGLTGSSLQLSIFATLRFSRLDHGHRTAWHKSLPLCGATVTLSLLLGAFIPPIHIDFILDIFSLSGVIFLALLNPSMAQLSSLGKSLLGDP